jgi:hypothetical protein
VSLERLAVQKILSFPRRNRREERRVWGLGGGKLGPMVPAPEGFTPRNHPRILVKTQITCRIRLFVIHALGEEAGFSALHGREAGKAAGIAGEEPTPKDLFGPGKVNGELDGILG